MIEKLKSIRDESRAALIELQNGSDEDEIQMEIKQAIAEIRKKYTDKRMMRISETELEIKALDNIIAKEESKLLYGSNNESV